MLLPRARPADCLPFYFTVSFQIEPWQDQPDAVLTLTQHSAQPELETRFGRQPSLRQDASLHT